MCPNWCENELTISGPNVESILANIGDQASDDQDRQFLDFDKVIPYPRHFKELDQRSAEYQEKFRAIALNDSEREGKLKALADEYAVEPGTPWLKDGFNSGGYEWKCDHWGTKWNACHVTINKRPDNSPPAQKISICAHCQTPHDTSAMTVLVCRQCGAPLPDMRPIVALLAFETAWSPPVPVVEKMASLFPEHNFELTYFEGGIGFCGHARWSQGQEEFHNESEYAGVRGG